MIRYSRKIKGNNLMRWLRMMKNGLRLGNSYLLFGAIKKIKNWPLYFMDLFWMIPRKMIIYSMRNGFKYVVRAKSGDRGVITIVCLADEYGICCHDFTADAIVIDIGANIGIFSVEVSRKVKKIFSYEPVPDNYDLLVKNIEINGLQGKVKAFNYAVSDNKKNLKIFLVEDNPGGHSMYADTKNYVEVPSLTLKEIFDTNDIRCCDLLKIDTEGAEYKIIYGLPLEYFDRIKKIFLEYHDINKLGTENVPENYNKEDLKKYLEKNGFRVYSRLDCYFAEHI
jgi:methyltransferase, FkbM family